MRAENSTSLEIVTYLIVVCHLGSISSKLDFNGKGQVTVNVVNELLKGSWLQVKFILHIGSVDSRLEAFYLASNIGVGL